MTTPTDYFGFRLPKELLDQYQEHCKKNGITASADIRRHIADTLKQRIDEMIAG